MTLPDVWSGIGGPAWLGLAYVSVFSMLVGFVFWYRGLALGGIAGVGQLQLLQPFFGLALAGPAARRAGRLDDDRGDRRSSSSASPAPSASPEPRRATQPMGPNGQRLVWAGPGFCVG